MEKFLQFVHTKMSFIPWQPHTTLQLFKFAVIGGLAAGVHLALVAFQVGQYQMAPLVANVSAFFVAFQVSFFGHQQWTFQGNSRPLKKTMHRYFVLAFSGFLLNEILYSFFLKLGLPYLVALILVLAMIPPLTFFISKRWIFSYVTD